MICTGPLYVSRKGQVAEALQSAPICPAVQLYGSRNASLASLEECIAGFSVSLKETEHPSNHHSLNGCEFATLRSLERQRFKPPEERGEDHSLEVLSPQSEGYPGSLHLVPDTCPRFPGGSHSMCYRLPRVLRRVYHAAKNDHAADCFHLCVVGIRWSRRPRAVDVVLQLFFGPNCDSRW